ncbi:MAG: prolipoprotein diacylglyceryl transferase [Patescibacteria group bacterium]
MFFHDFIPSPIILTIGPATFHWYGLFFGLGLAAAYLLANWRFKTWSSTGWSLDSLFVWLILGGIVGARLLDVFYFEWWYFKNHTSDLFLFWQGGLAWQGGLLGGGLAAWVYSIKYKIRLSSLADLLAPSLAFGQAIGRWGNYFNQEIFGRPTDLPWAIPIVQKLRPEIYQSFSHFQPIFFYEFLGLVSIGLFLLVIFKNKIGSGWQIAWYLLLAGALRFGLEFIRLDEQSVWLGLRAGFWLAGLSIVIGVVWLFKLAWLDHKSNKDI